MGGGVSTLTTSQDTSHEKPLPSPTLRLPSIFRRTFKPKPDDYIQGAIIGKGGFGTIREILRKKDNLWFALKIYELNEITVKVAELIVNELKALNRIPSHPFIIRWYATFRDARSLSFVMDLLPGGDLRMLLRLGERFTERQVAYIIGAIGSALHHIHLHRIIHRDVKPENIMFDGRGIPKLIDFGISFVLPPSSTICLCDSRSGTEQYVSPEAGVPETHYHGYESDFWSLGVVMYEMLFLSKPCDVDLYKLMVQYSQETYQSAWTKLLNGTIVDLTYLFNTLSTDLVPISTSCTFSPTSFDVSLPHTSPLRINIPTETYFGEKTSKECEHLLFSLLDVRIHIRIGVGQRYIPFQYHPWFHMNGVEFMTNALAEVTSPILPKFEEISCEIWKKYFSVNLVDYYPTESEISPVTLPPLVNFYLKQIPSISSLYYESL